MAELAEFKHLYLFPQWDIIKTSLKLLRQKRQTRIILRKKTCQAFHLRPCSTLDVRSAPVKTGISLQDFWVWSEKLVRHFWTVLGGGFGIEKPFSFQVSGVGASRKPCSEAGRFSICTFWTGCVLFLFHCTLRCEGWTFKCFVICGRSKRCRDENARQERKCGGLAAESKFRETLNNRKLAL